MKLRSNILSILLTFSLFSLSQTNKIEWEPHDFKSNSGEIVKAELGKLNVPEQRGVDNSRKIKLHFVRFKSTNPNPGSPIIYLAGGPGGSGINAAKGDRFKLFMSLRSIADVIAYDQRGTGLSNQIPKCPNVARIPIKTPGTNELYLSTFNNTASKCLKFWKENGVSINGYTTQENANDLEDLRLALGSDKLNLWGISYGSHLAFDYIKRYESSVGKVILAGLDGPGHNIKLPKNTDSFLKRLNLKIQKDEVASKFYPDLLELMKSVFNKLEKDPVIVDIKDPRSGNVMKVGISKLDVQIVTSFLLTKNPEDWTKLPYIYYQMNLGDFSTIGQYVAAIKSFAGEVRAMPLVSDVSSGVSNIRWKEIVNQSKKSLLGRTTNFPYPDIGKDLGILDLGESFRKNVDSNCSALFFSGTLDGRTYLEGANEILKGFKNAVHIIIDGAGHDMYMSTPEVNKIMINFMENNELDSRTIKIDVPKFITPN